MNSGVMLLMDSYLEQGSVHLPHARFQDDINQQGIIITKQIPDMGISWTNNFPTSMLARNTKFRKVFPQVNFFEEYKTTKENFMIWVE